jgi:hypothetical protein
MLKIDDKMLQDLGLGDLPPEEKKKLLAHVYETLEMRVGMKLASQMTDTQLDEFEAFIDTNDEEGALKWLENNFPDYKKVVADELDNLKEELKGGADTIIGAANTQPDQNQAKSSNPE